MLAGSWVFLEFLEEEASSLLMLMSPLLPHVIGWGVLIIFQWNETQFTRGVLHKTGLVFFTIVKYPEEQKHYKCVSKVFVIQKEFPFLICYSSVHNIKTQGNYVINLTIDYFSSNIWIFIVFLNIIFVLCLIV